MVETLIRLSSSFCRPQVDDTSTLERSASSAVAPTCASDATDTAGGATTDIFKHEVATYYGLTDPAGDDSYLVDMLGVRRKATDVQLASIFPALVSRAVALPADAHTTPSNVLLLPKDAHDAFDAGVVAFIPSSDNITIRVLKPTAPGGDVVALHIPRAAADGHWPCKRTLGWFAWLAKGAASAGASTAPSPSVGSAGDDDASGGGVPDDGSATKQRVRDAAPRLGLVTREW